MKPADFFASAKILGEADQRAVLGLQDESRLGKDGDLKLEAIFDRRDKVQWAAIPFVLICDLANVSLHPMEKVSVFRTHLANVNLALNIIVDPKVREPANIAERVLVLLSGFGHQRKPTVDLVRETQDVASICCTPFLCTRKRSWSVLAHTAKATAITTVVEVGHWWRRGLRVGVVLLVICREIACTYVQLIYSRFVFECMTVYSTALGRVAQDPEFNDRN
jgi:hypothetical protein